MQLMQIALTNNLTQVRMILAIGIPDTRGNAWLDMNGRVYDPNIGRFLSADPHIQAPYNTQSYNRYSYVLNNPLKYTDPSGYFFKWLARKVKKFVKRYGRQILAIGLGIVTQQWALAAKWGAFAQGVASGFVSGGISTGSIRGAINGAITGGFSARLAYTVGHGGVNNSSLFEVSFKTAVAHGVSQGALTRIQGGSFKSGFLGGSIGSYSSTFMNKESGWTNITKRTAIAATAGGIASELGGGKFANGARSAAFVHLFNAEGNISERIKNVLNTDVGGSGSIFVGIFGGSASTGAGIDTNGNKCLVSTICMQVGLGAFGGVGGNLSGGYDKHLITGRSQNWGFFINGGKGLAGGLNINLNNNGVSGAKGFGGGGLGGALGVQFCESYTSCYDN